MPDPASLIDEWVEDLLRDLDPEYARESLWSRLGLRPQPGPQEAFLRSEADIAIYGGAAGGGKSFGLLLAPLQWSHVPGFGAVIFRRTTTQVRAEGGLWDESQEMYSHLNGTPREQQLEWRFPSGAAVSFAHMEWERNRYDWQGSQICLIGFDELTHFCVDPETDVLTETGWKRIGEVTVGERVASYSPDRNIEYCAVTDTYASHYSGPMISVAQVHGINALMTPNHKVVVNVANNRGKVGKAKYGTWKLQRADSLKTCSIPRTGVWEGEEVDTIYLPVPTGRGHGPNSNSAAEIKADDWLQFLGWYLSEGCSFQMNTRTGSPVISIRQTADDGKDKIRELLDKLPWRYREEKDGQFRIFSRQLFDIVNPLGNTYTKRVPRWIFSLSPRQISLFLESFIDGDGYRTCTGGVQIGLANEGLIDDLQELCFLCGRVATKGFCVTRTGFDVWTLSISNPKRTHCFVKASQWERVDYDGMIHCITVEGNGTFLARRNGRYHWTGNSRKQFSYMFSRNRSTCGVRPRIMATTNPDADSWVAEFIAWWIDQETGFPIPERAGVLRWFVQIGDDLVWSDSAEDLKERYPDSLPMSVTFIPAKLDDNPALTQKDPGYRGKLMALDRVERERLLDGNWKIRPVAGMYFRREWFEIVDQAPTIDLAVRYWDFAGSKPTPRNKDPDWTVGLLLGYKPPMFYVLDVARMQDSPGVVEQSFIHTAELDGRTVPIFVEQEPGSSSLYLINSLVDKLPGHIVTGIPSTGSKQTRAKPVSSAAEHGKVALVRGEWNRAFLAELEYFPDGAHDDQVDALSGAHAALVELWKLLAAGDEGEVVTYGEEVNISPV